MAWTFNETPTTDRDRLRIIIGDTSFDDGPAPNRANLSDELLDFWLGEGGGVECAAALAFEHLSSLWISRPIFGPGELSTVHTNLSSKFADKAREWGARCNEPGAGSAVISVTSFTKSDAYSDNDSEYA